MLDVVGISVLSSNIAAAEKQQALHQRTRPVAPGPGPHRFRGLMVSMWKELVHD